MSIVQQLAQIRALHSFLHFLSADYNSTLMGVVVVVVVVVVILFHDGITRERFELSS